MMMRNIRTTNSVVLEQGQSRKMMILKDRSRKPLSWGKIHVITKLTFEDGVGIIIISAVVLLKQQSPCESLENVDSFLQSLIYKRSQGFFKGSVFFMTSEINDQGNNNKKLKSLGPNEICFSLIMISLS